MGMRRAIRNMRKPIYLGLLYGFSQPTPRSFLIKKQTIVGHVLTTLCTLEIYGYLAWHFRPLSPGTRTLMSYYDYHTTTLIGYMVELHSNMTGKLAWLADGVACGMWLVACGMT